MTLWNATPASDLWSDPANWAGNALPEQSAAFDGSSKTALSFAPASPEQVGEISFAATACPFSFTITRLEDSPALTVSGAGVLNASQAVQSFIVTSKGTYHKPQLLFTGSASAGPDTVSYYAGPEDLETSYGGGMITLRDTATAGAAHFTVRTGKLAPPDETSSLGGTVAFKGNATAGKATFSLFGTLGSDGDTFGNVVFHDDTTAAQGTFTNHGGTVPGGDGGNTQFYDRSSAGEGVYLNFGGTAHSDAGGGANGGDVAFDGVATGANGFYYNYPATVPGANGGVTSFNNNPNFPDMPNPGAVAGQGSYFNYGATQASPGKGGHTEFTARYGMATADQALIYNFGSALSSSSSAGHTIFATKPPCDFYPSAGQATIWNYPGVAAGYTVFQIYDGGVQDKVPTAANATIHNMGAAGADQVGGKTLFLNNTHAGSAHLIAYGGTGGGAGGQIVFSDTAEGDSATVTLISNGVLDISGHDSGITLASLETLPGCVHLCVGSDDRALQLSQSLLINGPPLEFTLAPVSGQKIAPNTPYCVLRAPNLSAFSPSRFIAEDVDGMPATFQIADDKLLVTFAAQSTDDDIPKAFHSPHRRV